MKAKFISQIKICDFFFVTNRQKTNTKFENQYRYQFWIQKISFVAEKKGLVSVITIPGPTSHVNTQNF